MTATDIFESLQELECALQYRSWHNPEDQSLREVHDLINSALVLWHQTHNI